MDGPVAEGFRETLGELLTLLREGQFPFHDDHHCTWCPFTDACRRHHPPSVERQRASAAGRRLELLHKKTGKKPLLKDALR